MTVHNSYDLMVVIDKLYQYLHRKGFRFDSSGFPVFEKSMFLSKWPNMVVPYSQRKNYRVTDKSKTVICFFDKDKNLYPRIAKVFDEIQEYQTFMGVVGLDITITYDMDKEWQRLNTLANQLFLAVLAVNNVKIVFNTRSGGLGCDEIFMNVPSNAICASGFLGCDLITADYDFEYLEKILYLLPAKLILYGKRDPKVEEQLDYHGIDYKYYKDFHRLCQAKEVHYGRQ